jgi:hypothetical protein
MVSVKDVIVVHGQQSHLLTAVIQVKRKDVWLLIYVHTVYIQLIFYVISN